MTIGQDQPEGATDASATFTNFQSVEEVIKFYKLPIKKARRTSSKALYEDFSAATFDSKTSSNVFTTDQKRLGFWILTLKNILHIDEKYKLNVNNKTNKNEINKIEIKVIDLESGIGSDYIILTIHVFLTTALIQCKGINLLDFEENIFPKIKGLVNKLTDISPTMPIRLQEKINYQYHHRHRYNQLLKYSNLQFTLMRIKPKITSNLIYYQQVPQKKSIQTREHC